jgi:gliding motility-associated-like protein
LLTLIIILISLSGKICGQISNCANISYKIENDQVCDPMNNIYSQTITFSFTNPNGKFIVGDTSYATVSSTQPILFKAASDASIDTIIAFFENDPSCKEIFVIQAPKNCCPFDLKLDSVYTGCIGQPIKVGAVKGNLIFNWLDSTGKFIGSNDSITIINQGKYTLIARSLTGCEKSTSFEVRFKSKPSLLIPPNFSVCQSFGDPVPIISDGNTFKWSRDGVLIDTVLSSKFVPTLQGNYTVTVSYFNSCPITGSVLVSLKNSTKPQLGQDLLRCETNIPTLNVSQIGSIEWFQNDILLPNEFQKTLSANKSGIYRVRLTGPNNCFQEDTVKVDLIPVPFLELGSGFALCKDETSSIQASTDVTKLRWRKNGSNLQDTSTVLKINSGGIFYASAESPKLASCVASDSILITTLPKPNITGPVGFFDSIFICENETGSLSFVQQGGLSYSWELNRDVLSNNETVAFNKSGILKYIVKDSNNCKSEDSLVIVKVENSIFPILKNIDTVCTGGSIPLRLKPGFENIIIFNNQELEKRNGGFFNAKEKGIYILQGIAMYNGKTCKDSDTLKLELFEQPIFDLGKDDSACKQFTIKPNKTYNAQYTWFANGTRLDSTRSSLIVNKSGTYELEMNTPDGCFFRDTIRLDIFPEITIQYTIDSIGSCDPFVKLLLPTVNATNFKWFLNGSRVFGADSSFMFTPISGIFRLEAKNEKCAASKEVKVNIFKPILFDLGKDTILCEGKSIKLMGPVGAAKYLWSTNDTISNIDVKNLKTSTRILLSVKTNEGCTSRDSIFIRYSPEIKLKVKGSLNPICLGDIKNITVAGAEKINWSSTNPEFKVINDSTVTVQLDKNILLRATASNVCGTDTVSIDLKPSAVPIVLISNDTCIYQGKSARLELLPGYKYQWQDHPSILGSLNNNIVDVMPDSTVLYRVNTFNANGCKRIDSIEVCVVELDREKFVPINVITPNGDGKNDELKFEILDLIQPNRLVIYNRWGNIVFEKNNYQSDNDLFDGTMNGEALPTDVYYYVLTFQDKVYKESLTILRN